MSNLTESAIGKRKSSIARVRFIKGNGKILINNCEPINYFKRKSLVMVMGQPLKLVDFDNKYDILVNVKGGGLSGQAGAVRLGISRNLQKINPDLRGILKKAGMLTRDSRVVERKKPGQPGARKKFQFSKR
jgi:small subunit ribosomal protein S9